MAKNIKLFIYKIKLIFRGQNTLIRNFKSNSNYITYKIFIIIYNN